MADEDLIIHKPIPESTQPRPHPAEERRTKYALAISLGAAFVSIFATIGTVWQAIEVRQTRLDAKEAMDSQAADVQRSRRSAEQSAQAVVALAQAMNRVATASESSAEFSKISSQTAQQALLVGTRPQLETTVAQYDPETLEVKLTIINKGQTTASGLVLRYWMEGGNFCCEGTRIFKYAKKW
jgi:midasin (ATPase involved in ribosome maturation)